MSIKFRVDTQGAPVFENGWVVRRSRHVICVELDMRSKYTTVDATSGHTVLIGANERSIHLEPSVDRSQFTSLAIDGMPKDFEFFSASGGRYTISICYIRRQSRSQKLLEWVDHQMWRLRSLINRREHAQDQDQ